MLELLFLEVSMYDKIWGGIKLRDEFGYDILSEIIGEYWVILVYFNGVLRVKNGCFKGCFLDKLY